MVEYDSIMEIAGRSQIGTTRPFVCRCEKDGKLAFVKGENSGYHSLIAEVICAILGQELDIPIPEPRIVTVPSCFRNSSVDEFGDLGVGEWFASIEIEKSSMLLFNQKNIVPASMQSIILFFDIWIANRDRSAGINGGNSNMLTNGIDSFYVIDHNIAFEPLSINAILEDHLFADRIDDIRTSSFEKQYRSITEKCCTTLTAIYENNLPEEWIDKESLTLDTVCSILERCNNDNFWRFEDE